MSTKTVENNFVIDHEGRDIYVEISPCSWMYPTYGLQIRIASKQHACNAEAVFDRDASVNACELSRTAMVSAARAQATKWLAANGVTELDAKIAKWAKDSVRLDAAILKEQAKAAKARRKRLTKHQAEGYTHVVDGWIHPASGDDYQVEACTVGHPTAQDIRKIFTKSKINTDYQVALIETVLR